MNRIILFLLPVVAVAALLQCETPGSPDFTLSSSIDAPLLADSNFRFLGDSNALIDTTNEDLRDLFDVDSDNFITLSQQEEFDFGDLDDAVPDIDIEPTTFESMVGEIELDDFSSQDENGNIGEAGFEDLTGQTVPLQQGDPLLGAQTPVPVNVDIDTDYFVSASIKEGGMVISIKNELGFDLDELTLDLRSGNSPLGTLVYPDFDHGTSQSEFLMLVENPETEGDLLLEDINVNVSISWSTQNMKDDAGSIIITDVKGENLIASSVNAIIGSKEFFSSGISEFSDEDILFSSAGHFVELESGELSIQNIINTIDLDIDVLEISFPQIRTAPYSEADSLVIRFDGSERIPRNNTSPISRSSSLDNMRIYALDNRVSYNIYAVTENTREGNSSDSRIIRENDFVEAEVLMENLLIREVFGIIRNRQILLNSDVASDGSSVDIKNDFEAEVINIDGIDELSRRIDGIEFTRASLSVNYVTNVDVPTAVIGAFLGVDANGNEFFLQGEPGTESEVQPADPTEKLVMNGAPIPASNLIKFKLDENGESQGKMLSTSFDRTNSNIAEFLNRLPVSIRFVGLADINPENGEGLIRNPVQFDPVLSVNIPLAIRADRATFTDTTSADLGGLPGANDDAILEEGSISIKYQNRIPLGISLDLEFLDEEGEVLTALPITSDEVIEFFPAAVGAGGFSVEAAEDFTVIRLNRNQLDQINLTRNLRLIAGISTTATDEIRIRSTDDIDISVSGKFVIRNKID